MSGGAWKLYQRAGLIVHLREKHRVHVGESPPLFASSEYLSDALHHHYTLYRRNNSRSPVPSRLPIQTLTQPNQPTMTRMPYPVGFHNTMAPPTYHLDTSPPTSVRAHFLQNTVSATYSFPPGPVLNFTMVEIITFLPHLYKEPHIAYRFLNNYMTTAIHFAILSAHRSLHLVSDAAATQAREIITEGYRLAMRKWRPNWTRAAHVVPSGWDALALAVHNVEPVAAREEGYRVPPAVPFRRLMDGVRMAPRGSDKGDLTRAVEFARDNAKVDAEARVREWMFPDDIQVILDLCGRTEATLEHGDRRAVRRWSDNMAKGRNQVAPLLPGVAEMQHPTFWGASWVDEQRYEYAGFETADHFVTMPTAAHVLLEPRQMLCHHLQCTDNAYSPGFYADNYPSPIPSDPYHQIDKMFYLPPAIEQQTTTPIWNQVVDVSSDDAVAVMDELLRPYLPHKQPEPAFLLPESGLLRDLPEPASDDETDLAITVRFARQPNQLATDWHFDEVHVLAELLKFDGIVEDDGWLDLDKQV
jgi:hypothetical protein